MFLRSHIILRLRSIPLCYGRTGAEPEANLWRRAEHQQHAARNTCVCRALVHDRSQCPTPLRAGLLGPRVVSPHPQGLQGSHLNLSQTSAQRHMTYFLLNNKAVNAEVVVTAAGRDVRGVRALHFHDLFERHTLSRSATHASTAVAPARCGAILCDSAVRGRAGSGRRRHQRWSAVRAAGHHKNGWRLGAAGLAGSISAGDARPLHSRAHACPLRLPRNPPPPRRAPDRAHRPPPPPRLQEQDRGRLIVDVESEEPVDHRQPLAGRGLGHSQHP